MSEANQLKKPSENNGGFDNRNYNRRNPSYPEASNRFPKVATPKETNIAPATPKFPAPESSPHPVVVQQKTSLKTKPENLRLTHRDYKILEFILDMKFASKETLFQKFFSRTYDSRDAKTIQYCAERLYLLVKAGYIEPDLKITIPGERFYLATDKAHEAINLKIQLEKVPKPRKYIDSTVFVHDRLVAHSRLEFEKANPGCRWISDLRLRAGMAALYNLPSVYIPDAIYELSSGERVAFEFENARKGRGAYREKINYFAKLIESKRDDPNMFTRVRYRCVRPDVYNVLVEETSLYPGVFTVELWESPPGIDAGGKNPLPKYLQPKIENLGTEAEG